MKFSEMIAHVVADGGFDVISRDDPCWCGVEGDGYIASFGPEGSEGCIVLDEDDPFSAIQVFDGDGEMIAHFIVGKGEIL